MKMNFNELTQLLHSAGLYPIHIEGSVNKSDADGFAFLGELDEYIEAVKAIKSDIVFVSNRLLEEPDFTYESADEADFDDDVEDKLPTTFYLPSIVPALADFKEHIGEDCAFKLSAPLASGSLDFYLREKWYLEFIEAYFQAVDKVEADKGALISELEARKEEEEKNLLNRLRNLVNDNEFTSQPTQRAMLAYALEKIPEVESLGRSVLKAEIQALDDKIKIKGRSRKH